MKHWKRVRDVSIEVFVVSGLIAVAVAYKLYHPTADLPWPWIALTGNTAIVFGSLLVWFRRAWKKPVFWVCLGIVLLGHATVYVLVLNRIHKFPLQYYVLLNSGELAAFAPILERFASEGK